MIEHLNHENLSQSLNTRFRTNLGPDQIVELELVEISELRLSSRHEEFSIIFRGPSEIFLGQGTRLLHHDALGEFELFLVPVGQDSTGYQYQAVFSRFRNPPGAES